MLNFHCYARIWSNLSLHKSCECYCNLSETLLQLPCYVHRVLLPGSHLLFLALTFFLLLLLPSSQVARLVT